MWREGRNSPDLVDQTLDEPFLLGRSMRAGTGNGLLGRGLSDGVGGGHVGVREEGWTEVATEKVGLDLDERAIERGCSETDVSAKEQRSLRSLRGQVLKSRRRLKAAFPR